VRQLTATPVLDPVHDTATGGDQALVALQHGRNLFALIRMDQQNDFVVTHVYSLWIPARTSPGRGSRATASRRGCGKGEPEILARKAQMTKSAAAAGAGQGDGGLRSPSTKSRSRWLGAVVSRLTSTSTSAPAGTPKTPAEAGWMPQMSVAGPG